MPIPSVTLWYPASVDYTADPMPGLIRCNTDTAGGSGSIDIQLPQVEGDAGTGATVTIANIGKTHDVLVSQLGGELIADSPGTLRIKPGWTIKLLGGEVSTKNNGGAFGWDVIGGYLAGTGVA
jgi:hypothetical protein